jgi:hypothetical protein
VKRGVILLLLFALVITPGYCCISDPSVTVVYNISVDMDLLKSLKQEGFSFDLIYDVIPSFGAEGRREFAVYKAHYGLATAMVAYDMVVIKAHEEKYDWEKGFKTELTFLETIEVLHGVDIDTVSEVASWESTSGKNLFPIPEEVEFISFGNDVYPVSEPVQTDYLYFHDRWIAVPGNATISVEGDTLSILLLRCGSEISADTSRLELFAPLRDVILVCNSIDYKLTGKELVTILAERGFAVKRIEPDEFDVYRWFSPKIILLGGHKSPENMGEIVSGLLPDPEKQMIENQGLCMFAHEDMDFRRQGMLFLAGKDREETHDIVLSRLDDIILWLEYIP